MKKIIDKTFWIYVVLGLLNYGFCSLIMLLIRNLLKVDEFWCKVISFSIQTMISFLLNRYVTFRGIEISKHWPTKFVLSIAVCWVAANVFMNRLYLMLVELPFFVSLTDWLRDLLHISLEPREFRSQLVMLATLFTYCVFNYAGQRYFVFRPVNKKEVQDK